MKKLFILVLCAGLASGSFAQDSARKAGMKDLRKDLKDLKKDRKDRAADIKAGDKADAAKDSKDIRNDKKDIVKDAKTLKAKGVKHPIKRAEKQIRKPH